MKTQYRSFTIKLARAALAFAGMLAVMRVIAAQPVIMGAPPENTAPVAVAEAATNNDMAVFEPAGVERDWSLPEPFKYGPFVLRPHPYYQFIYGTGLQAGVNNVADSVVQEISPGFALDLGRHWTVDYTPTIRLYSSRAFHDSVDHSASLTGGTRYEDWVLGLSQTFASSDQTLAETATQTKQQEYVTGLTASHQLNDKFSTDLAVNQDFNLVVGQQNSHTWSTLDWLNYQVATRLFFGVGGGGGYTTLSVGPDESFEQLNGRIQWRATDKISFSGNVGLEDRQFLAAGYKDALNPIFGVSAQYEPFKHTDISLAANRTVSSSDYSVIAQSTETTTVSLNVNQRLLEKFFLNVGVSWTQTEYSQNFTLPTVPPIPVGTIRTDDNYSFNARLGHTFLKRGNVAVTYQYGDNQSTAAGYSYRSNQVGFEVGFTY